jgi:cephalosporin hydroxylase
MESTPSAGKKSVSRTILAATHPLRMKVGVTRSQIASRRFSLWLWQTLVGTHPLVFFYTDLFPQEADLLLRLFGERRPKTYLEVGVFWGGTFEKVLKHRDSLSLPTKCIGLDIWDEVKDSANSTHISGCPNREAVHMALARRGYRNFELLVGLSSQVRNRVKEKIDFAFHDANHTYAAVREDLDQLHPLLSDGATVLIHNASMDLEPDKSDYEADGGPYQAAIDLAAAGNWTLEKMENRMAVLRRKP